MVMSKTLNDPGLISDVIKQNESELTNIDFETNKQRKFG